MRKGTNNANSWQCQDGLDGLSECRHANVANLVPRQSEKVHVRHGPIGAVNDKWTD